MNTLKIALILLLLPLQARAGAIPLGEIDITLEVTAQPRIEIEKLQGDFSSRKLLNWDVHST